MRWITLIFRTCKVTIYGDTFEQRVILLTLRIYVNEEINTINECDINLHSG